MKRHLQAAWRVLPAAILAGCVVAIVVRLTIRDRVPGIAALFYAAPPAVLAAGALGAAGLWGARRALRPAGMALVLALACAGWWRETAWFSNDPLPAAPGAVRLLFWNTSHGNGRWGEIARRIRASDADVIGLVEAQVERPSGESYWREAVPGYHLHQGEGAAFLSRGRFLEPPSRHVIGPRSRCHEFVVEAQGRPLHILLVDLTSNPCSPRGGPIRALWGILEGRLSGPLVVMGDFNTPSDSVFLDPWRERLSNAFEARGRGLAATWPAPLPVLSLDQLWASPSVRILRCEHSGGWPSDHRSVLADVAVR